MSDETGRPPIDLAAESDFRLGSLLVSPSTREVSHGGTREMLEPRVMQVLVALFQGNGRVISRDELIARCWEGRIVGEDAINRAIGRLRRLSETGSDAPFGIETIPRVGYRLTVADLPAAVETEAPPVTPPLQNSLAPPLSPPTPEPEALAAHRKRLPWMAAAAVAVFAALAA